MAFINDMYVFVDGNGESVTRGVEVSSHPVESGLDITDNVKRLPITISLTGKIVGKDAAAVLRNLTALHHSGKLIKYSGRNIINNAIIESFETGHPNTIWGGCSFSMTIKETRIAKPAYIAPKTTNTTTKKATKSGTQQVESNTTNKYHTVKSGDTLWAIAKAYYGSGSHYTKIYEANKDKISNPNLIYVGQVLLIPSPTHNGAVKSSVSKSSTATKKTTSTSTAIATVNRTKTQQTSVITPSRSAASYAAAAYAEWQNSRG